MDNSKFYLVVAGSRSFTNYELMESKLNHFLVNVSKPVVIIHGGARGADTLAGRYASEHKLECKVFPADWDSLGKSAGYVRNRRMHAYIANASDRGCVCFWDGKSRGTTHNFKLAEEFGNPLRIVRFDKEESKGSSSTLCNIIIRDGSIKKTLHYNLAKSDAIAFCENHNYVYCDCHEFLWDLEIEEASK